MELVPRPAIELSQLSDPSAAAEMIIWLGLRNHQASPQQGENEENRDYTQRAWKELSRNTRQEVIEIGLQVASWYRDGIQDGVQLVIYRTYANGWIGFDSEAEFRMWVRDQIGDEGSAAEASQLASTILNLIWLQTNGFQGIPNNLEEIFGNRSEYNRWRRIASGLKNLIEAADSGELDDEIQEMIDDVNDSNNTMADLDKLGRVAPRLPKANIEILNYEEDGTRMIRGYLTDAQIAVLRQHTRSSAQWILKGEEYGVNVTRMVMYRKQEFPTETWASREHHGTEWTEWKHLAEKPALDGYPVGMPFNDPELGLTYYRMWEE